MLKKMFKDRTGTNKLKTKNFIFMVCLIVFCVWGLGLTGCDDKENRQVWQEPDKRLDLEVPDNERNENDELADIIDFNHKLDEYKPLKKKYNLNNSKVYIYITNEIISYMDYCKYLNTIKERR